MFAFTLNAALNRWYYGIVINLPTHWHYNLDSGSTYCHKNTSVDPNTFRDFLEFIDFFISPL